MTEPPPEPTSLGGPPDQDGSGPTTPPGPADRPVRQPGAHLRTADDGDPITTKGRRSNTRNMVEWALVIGGALLIALFVRTYLVQTFYIPSSSMEPTLMVGDRVLVNKLSYQWGDIKPGQIVVFDRPGGPSPDGIDVLIKRVIAVGGDEVAAEDGTVYRNGEALEERYLPDGTSTADFGPITVPDDSIWLMGDNRGNSDDSRHFGPIPKKDVVGRAFVTIWPLGDIGWL